MHKKDKGISEQVQRDSGNYGHYTTTQKNEYTEREKRMKDNIIVTFTCFMALIIIIGFCYFKPTAKSAFGGATFHADVCYNDIANLTRPNTARKDN